MDKIIKRLQTMTKYMDFTLQEEFRKIGLG
jgi:hypothetical protein